MKKYALITLALSIYVSIFYSPSPEVLEDYIFDISSQRVKIKTMNEQELLIIYAEGNSIMEDKLSMENEKP